MTGRISAVILSILMVAAGDGIAQDTKENAEFRLAVGLYNDGFYPQAEDQFKVFVEKFPNTSLGIEARYYLGLIQVKTKKYGDAKNTLQDFAIRYPDNPKAPEALWNLAEVFALERNHAEAASAFARLKTFYPKDKRAPQALLQAGKYFLKADDTRNARIVLNSIINEYPQSDAIMEAYYMLGRLLIASGDFEPALRELKRITASAVTPQALKGKAAVAMGEVHAAMGNRDDAEKQYREVIALYGKTDALYAAYVRLGDLQRQFQQFTEAVASYDAVANNPSAPAEYRLEALIGKAEAAIHAEQFGDAARAYASVFQSFKDQTFEADVYRRAAYAAGRAGDYTTAGRYLEQLYQDTLIAVDRRAVLVEMADVAREARKYNAAVQAYQTYLRQYPMDDGAPFALFAIGEMFEQQFHNPTNALEVYSSVLERFGASPVADRAQLGKARSFEALGKYEEAADAFRLLMAQFPASAYYTEAKRRLTDLQRFRPGTPAKAIAGIAEVLRAMNDRPSSASVDVLLANLYLRDLKDFKLALQYFTSAISKGVSGEEADRAAYGKVLATLRLAQNGEGSKAEATAALEEYVRKAQQGASRDEAAYELFLLQSENQPPAYVLDAAAKFLALNPAQHRQEARLAFADALRASGRNAEAEQEYTKILADFQEADTRADASFGRGLVRTVLQNFNGAVEDFRSSEREQPVGRSTAPALMALGRTLSRTGRYSEAAQTYESLADRFNYSPLADSAQIALISVLGEGGMHDRATARGAILSQHVRSNPFLSVDVVSEYLYAYAVALARNRDVTAAKRVLQQYATEYPKGGRISDVYYALGQIFKDEGKTILAASYLRQAAKLSTGVQARQDAADLLLEDQRFAEAMREYEAIASNASASRVEKSYAQSRIVVALYRSDKPADAQQRAAEFKSQYPDAQPVFDEFELERGKHLYRQKQYKQAMDVFEKVDDSKTQEIAAMAVYWIGKTFETQSMNPKAQERFDEVVKKYPNTDAAMEASLALARMAFRAEKYDVAALQFKNVVDAPRVSQSLLKEALTGLIACYEELRIYDAAAEMTKRFLDTWPNDPTAFRKRVNLGQYYYQLRYFDQAILLYKTLLDEAPPNDQAELRYYMGECYFYKGDFTQAALEFLAVPYLVVQKTEPDWRALAYAMAAQSYEKQSKFNLALEMYQKILSTSGIDPNDRAEAEKNVKRLQALIKP